MFLGIAAWMIAGALYMEWISNWQTAVTAWFILSILLTMTLRELAQKWLPGEVNKADVNADRNAVGEIAEVIQEIPDNGEEGRISFQGTSWKAVSEGNKFKTGEKVKIKGRDNLVWIVEESETNKNT